MFHVVGLWGGPVECPQVHRNDPQSLGFDPGQDISDEPALHSVGFDEDQGTLSHEFLLGVGVAAPDDAMMPDEPGQANDPLVTGMPRICRGIRINQSLNAEPVKSGWRTAARPG